MGRMNRRDFLATAAAGTLAMSPLARSAGAGDANKRKLKLGLIGCGGYGMADVRAAFKVGGVEVAA